MFDAKGVVVFFHGNRGEDSSKAEDHHVGCGTSIITRTKGWETVRPSGQYCTIQLRSYQTSIKN